MFTELRHKFFNSRFWWLVYASRTKEQRKLAAETRQRAYTARKRIIGK